MHCARTHWQDPLSTILCSWAMHLTDTHFIVLNDAGKGWRSCIFIWIKPVLTQYYQMGEFKRNHNLIMLVIIFHALSQKNFQIRIQPLSFLLT